MKEKVKKFWEKWKLEIICGGFACAWVTGWAIYVRRNTFDLQKPIVSGVNVLEFYRQFGETVMNAETTVEEINKLSTMISNTFGPAGNVYVMITE